jgi:UDP-N-acetyl-D-galactosamine dehydrogenase
LKDYGIEVDVFDPWVDATEAEHEYGITPTSRPEHGAYDGIVLAVAHKEFVEMGLTGMRHLGREEHVLYDLKYILPADQSDLRL